MAKKKTRSEEESYRLYFFIIAQLLMLSMGWLLYQEFLSRRPWWNYQLSWFQVQAERANKNLSSARNYLANGTIETEEGDELKVADQVAGLEKELNELTGDIMDSSAKRVEFETAKDKLEEAEIGVTDAEIVLAFAKADEDEKYYYFRNAKHHGHDYSAEEQAYEKVHKEVLEASREYDEATAKRDALLDTVTAFEKAINEKTKALEGLKGDVVAAERAAESIDSQFAGIDQFWNQEIELVDRCHTCHAGYDKCGFTSPEEILSYILKDNLNAVDLKTRFCLTREEIERYEEVAEEVRDSWYEETKLTYADVKGRLLSAGCAEIDNAKIVADGVKGELSDDELAAKYCLSGQEAGAYRQAIRSMQAAGEGAKFADVKGSLDKAIKLIEPSKTRVAEPVLKHAEEIAEQYGITTEGVEELYRTHPDYWNLIRKHPVQKYGCTTCHYGQGRQTKGIGLNYLAAMLWKWDKNMAPFDHAKSDHYWIEQILDSDRNHTEASCFNCHMKDYELDYAPNFTRARKLVQHLGCTGCHPIGVLDSDRKHGPPLTTVINKGNQDWLYSWIQYPKGLRPRTRMPNFWPSALEKSGANDLDRDDCNVYNFEKGGPVSPAVPGNCFEQREQESAYILAYLKAQNVPQSYEKMPAWADAAAGKVTFEEVGCRGCHNMGDWQQASHMPGSEDRDLAPNLTNIGDKLNAGWVYQWIKNPKGYWKHTRMPSLRLTDKEAWNVAAYLTSNKSGAPPKMSSKALGYLGEEGAADKGKTLIAYYGCAGCHLISGFEDASRIAADLTLFGSKGPHKLDFGDVLEMVNDPHEQTWENWTTNKLQRPRSYSYERATTRMPQFDLSEDEVRDTLLFLKSQNEMAQGYPEHVKRMADERKDAIQRGEFLLDVYNCSGCHLIDDQGIDVDGDNKLDGGDIYRLYADTEEKYRAPPKLMGQGAKLYPDWFFNFLKEPFKLRENYKIRMPTFQFTDEQAADIVAYFAAKSGTPYPYIEPKRDALSDSDRALADKLFREAQCTNCHALEEGAPQDVKNVAPNLRLGAARLQYDWLADWLKDPQSIAPGVGMPSFFAPNDDVPGEYITPLTDLADGDWRKQVELLRAYVIELGHPAIKKQEASASPPKKKKRRRG